MINDIKQKRKDYIENGYMSSHNNDGNITNSDYIGEHIFYCNGVYNGFKSYDINIDVGLELLINHSFNEYIYHYFL